MERQIEIVTFIQLKYGSFCQVQNILGNAKCFHLGPLRPLRTDRAPLPILSADIMTHQPLAAGQGALAPAAGVLERHDREEN